LSRAMSILTRELKAKRRSERGRPKGSSGGGRPGKDLSHDPWRYLYAAAQFAIDQSRTVNGGVSELQICETFAALMLGRPLREGEFIIDGDGKVVINATGAGEAMREGRLFPVIHRKKWDGLPAHGRDAWRARKPHPSANGTWPWREADEFRSAADNLRARLYDLRKRQPVNSRRRHFDGLRFLLDTCFQAPERADSATRVADEIGERFYWEATLRPLMARHTARRAAGECKLPFGAFIDELSRIAGRPLLR
jgi:hypothetical protein